jgi:hypothetical protein
MGMSDDTDNDAASQLTPLAKSPEVVEAAQRLLIENPRATIQEVTVLNQRTVLLTIATAELHTLRVPVTLHGVGEIAELDHLERRMTQENRRLVVAGLVFGVLAIAAASLAVAAAVWTVAAATLWTAGALVPVGARMAVALYRAPHELSRQFRRNQLGHLAGEQVVGALTARNAEHSPKLLLESDVTHE